MFFELSENKGSELSQSAVKATHQLQHHSQEVVGIIGSSILIFQSLENTIPSLHSTIEVLLFFIGIVV